MGGEAKRLNGAGIAAPDAPTGASGELPAPLAGGKYVFVRRLGSGGFGSVWQGLLVQARLRKDVAIKLLRPELFRNPDWRSFDNESLAARLSNPHIADIYELVEEADRCALIMEYLEGRSLKERLMQLGPLSAASTLRVARAVAEGLLAAHSAGVIHRDIKPGNIMVGPSPDIEEDDIKIIDWGLALGVPRWGADERNANDVTSQHVGTMDERLLFAGTKQYMSPERFAGVIDHRADIWAYGCVLYECLTGRRAFDGDDVLERITEGRCDFDALPPQTPAVLRDIIGQCLRPDRGERMRGISGALALLDSDSGRSSPHWRAPLLDLLPALPGEAKEVARAALVNEVAIAVTKSPLVALSGPCGSGKSWVALKVAHGVLADARQGRGAITGGVGRVDLRGASDVAQALHRIAVVVGELVNASSPAADCAKLKRAIEQHPRGGLLLVLDDADGVLRELPSLLGQLRTPGLHVIVTARRSPPDAGWDVHAVDPLDVPPEKGVQSEKSVLSFESVQLFLKRAIASWRHFSLDTKNVDAVATICRRVDGLPSAIEMVASRVRFETPQQILDRLSQYVQPLLTSPSHETMSRTIAWSIDSASPDERLLLERLSIFEGAWTLASVESVCCDDRLPKSALFELLNGLIEQSLVRAERARWVPRYRLLETVRDLCRRRLEAPERSDELAALRRRHLKRFAGLIVPDEGRSEARRGELSSRLERVDLRHEEADCTAAIRFALGDPSTIETAADIAIEMQEDWYQRGRYKEGADLLNALLTAWGDRRDLRHLRLLAARANLVWLRDPRAAYDGLRAALAIQRDRLRHCQADARQIEEERLAKILHNAGLMALQAPQPNASSESRAALGEALSLYGTFGNARGEAETRLSCVVLDVYDRRLDDAERHLEAAVVNLPSDDTMRIGMAYFYRGRIAFFRGNHPLALRWCRESLALRMKTDEPEGVAECIRFAGEIAARAGNANAAATLFGAAHRRREVLGVDVQASEAAVYEECIRRVREDLSRDEFADAWDRGGALSDEESAEFIAECLRG